MTIVIARSLAKPVRASGVSFHSFIPIRARDRSNARSVAIDVVGRMTKQADGPKTVAFAHRVRVVFSFFATSIARFWTSLVLTRPRHSFHECALVERSTID